MVFDERPSHASRISLSLPKYTREGIVAYNHHSFHPSYYVENTSLVQLELIVFKCDIVT